MAYVDLNPVRAGIENDLFDSDFTSIQQRLFDYALEKQPGTTPHFEENGLNAFKNNRPLKQAQNLDTLPEAPLMPFDGSSQTELHRPPVLP